MNNRILIGAFALAAAFLTFAPTSGAQIATASVGGEYRCTTLTMTCEYRTVGFHTGLPTFAGTSSWGASNGACSITLTACQSRGPVWFVSAWGSCLPAFAQTQGLAQDADPAMCMP